MISVRVPGSSANLGPGFDAFAAALALHLELEVRGDRLVRLPHRPARRPRPSQPRRARVRAAASAGSLRVPDALLDPALRRARLQRRGVRRRAASPPTGSAAAARTSSRTRSRWRAIPDNVAASLLGGVTVYVDGRAARLEPPEGLSAILVVPRAAVRTSAARAALPATRAARRRGRQLRPRRAARARPGARRPGPRRGRAARPDPPALPRPPVPAVRGAPGARAGARSARGDDLGRRADGAGLGADRGGRRTCARRSSARRTGGRRSCRPRSSRAARRCSRARTLELWRRAALAREAGPRPSRSPT